jgi:hypothetical protein
LLLEQEFEYFLSHQTELVERYEGKVIVIKNGSVLGAFDNHAEAVREISKIHPLGTFLVQKCDAGTEAYKQTFHSRVTPARS